MPTIRPPTDWSQVTAPGGPDSGLRVGAIVSRTFGSWWRDLPVYVLLALVAAAPAAWSSYEMYARAPELLVFDPTSENPFRQIAQLYARIGGPMFASFVLWAIEAGAVIHCAAARLRGTRAQLGEAISVGLRRSFAMFALLLLVALALVATACTLVVPILLASGWAASAAAVGVEGQGPIRALGRSWELTRGHRWKVLGGSILVYLAVLVATWGSQWMLTGGRAYQPAVGAGAAEALRAMATPMAIYTLVAAILGTPLLVTSAVVHHQLRLLKEGGDPAHLRRVFE